MNKPELIAKITTIAETLRIIEAKLKSLAETDRLAYHSVHKQYIQLDEECLDLMTKLHNLESLPPDHTELIICSI